jgi:hypothetical protein
MGVTSSRPSTAQVSRRKRDERERLVVEMEELLGIGLKEGDQEILDSRSVNLRFSSSRTSYRENVYVDLQADT